MLPVVALGRHCCSLATDLENYRPLVGDELTDESVTWLADLMAFAFATLMQPPPVAE
jgi:hypothetical protein